MPESAVFPSQIWFERLREQWLADETVNRGLGPIDCTMVVKVELEAGRDALYEVAFEAFDVKSIRKLARIEDAPPSHFVIEGSLDAWREMIENIRQRGAADLEHTLNYLTLPDVPMRVSGPDQLETDAFYRYNETLQRFFEGVAHIETSFQSSHAPRTTSAAAPAPG